MLGRTLIVAGLALLISGGGAAAISLETAPPVVVRTSPTAGAAGVDPALSEIRVTFSKPMQDGSWSWSTWGEENFPEITGPIRYETDQRTCVLPVKLEPGKFYATWLNSEKFRNFKDTDGRPAVPYLLTFTTAVGQASGPIDLRQCVEDFFAHNFRDVTSRQTLEWGRVETNANGNLSIRYKYRARIWDKDTVTNNQVFTFDPKGKFVCVADAAAAGSSASDTVPSLNADQRAVVAWTDRQFRSYFDDRAFDGWTAEDLETLETKCLDALNGPRGRDYYTAINTLGALRSTNALPPLRGIAFERVDGNNRNRWMAARVLGIMGDRQSVPDLITLVYHGNPNTRWWAQIALVQLTGRNFGGDWEAWGKCWNASGGQPAYSPEIIRWWSGQAETVEGLRQSLEESDRKFLESIAPQNTVPKDTGMEDRE